MENLINWPCLRSILIISLGNIFDMFLETYNSKHHSYNRYHGNDCFKLTWRYSSSTIDNCHKNSKNNSDYIVNALKGIDWLPIFLVVFIDPQSIYDERYQTPGVCKCNQCKDCENFEPSLGIQATAACDIAVVDGLLIEVVWALYLSLVQEEPLLLGRSSCHLLILAAWSSHLLILARSRHLLILTWIRHLLVLTWRWELVLVWWHLLILTWQHLMVLLWISWLALWYSSIWGISFRDSLNYVVWLLFRHLYL